MTTVITHSAVITHSGFAAMATNSTAIGFVASALVFAAFGMKDMVNLRIVAICSNVAFIAYALVLNLPPILILHAILLPLNGWRLAQELQSRRIVQRSSRTYVAVAPVRKAILISQGHPSSLI